jgi:hypothetical protein
MKSYKASPETLAKMSAAMKGRTFLARGGNGKLTVPQERLARALGSKHKEHPILTRPVHGRFKSLPHCYKVDIALPRLKIAIEVDGKTHRTKKWRFLDHRKTEILNALGWSVLRFTNERVMNELPVVLAEIRSFMTSKSKKRTTSSRMG